MIRTYDMASGERLDQSPRKAPPSTVLNDGLPDILYPTFQLQEITLVPETGTARFTPDLATKSIDSFFD